jgi:hypothetical protein
MLKLNTKQLLLQYIKVHTGFEGNELRGQITLSYPDNPCIFSISDPVPVDDFQAT